MKKLIIVFIATLVMVAIFGVLNTIKRVFSNPVFVQNAKNALDDQDEKTAVALIELHKLRYGRYPASLQELKFTGPWDDLALGEVSYVCNPEGNAYYVEIKSETVKNQIAQMPKEFWRGTGFKESLKPVRP